jgi:hypothetical protein
VTNSFAPVSWFWFLTISCPECSGRQLSNTLKARSDTPADNYGQDQATGSSHKLIHIPAPHDGPVVVMIDIEVDRTLGRDMLDVLREVRLIRLRNGAFNWRLHEDLGRPNTYRVEMMYRVESAI